MTTRTLTLLFAITALALGLALGGCAGHGHVRVAGHVDAHPPTLVYIGSGLWVVEDYPRPVFYSDGWYWLYADGVWMRSDSYAGGFARVDTSVVPRTVVRIERPRRYVRYKASANARVRKGPPPHARDHRKKVETRDHRDHDEKVESRRNERSRHHRERKRHR